MEVPESPEERQKKIDEAAEENRKFFLKAVEAEERMKICRECDKYLKKARICGVCKCFMPMKIRMRSADCPLEKW